MEIVKSFPHFSGGIYRSFIQIYFNQYINILRSVFRLSMNPSQFGWFFSPLHPVFLPFLIFYSTHLISYTYADSMCALFTFNFWAKMFLH